MEEKRYTTHRLMCCPHCGNPEPVYITEYHKEIFLRMFCSLLNVIMWFLFLLFIGNTIESFDEIFNVISLIFNGKMPSELNLLLVLWLLKIFFKCIIMYRESKTHVQAICRTCGNIWLLN